MPDFSTRLTRAFDDFINIQLGISNERVEAFTSQWRDLFGDGKAAKDAGLTDEQTDRQVYEIADAMAHLCEGLLDISLADNARFDDYNSKIDGLVADTEVTAWLSMQDINPDDRVVLFDDSTPEHDAPPFYDEPVTTHASRFSRSSSPADDSSTSSSRAPSVFSSWSPASSQSSLPSRSSSPCSGRSVSPACSDRLQDDNASSSSNQDQLAAFRMFGYASDTITHQQPSSVSDDSQPLLTSMPPPFAKGLSSPNPILHSDIVGQDETIREQDQGLGSTLLGLTVKRQREAGEDDDCPRPFKIQRQASPVRPQRALPRRRVLAGQRNAPNVVRPSTLLSSAVRWLVEHPGVLFPSQSTARSIGLATGRSVSEVDFAFKDIRRQLKVEQIPRFFLQAEHLNRWCAGYWHMRRLKEEKGWGRLNREEKAFCIAFEEHGRVGQAGQGEVVVDEPRRSYVIAHLNRIRADMESAYRCMTGITTNLSTMGHWVTDRVAAVSPEANTRERENIDLGTQSFNDWAAHLLCTNRNRKRAREPLVQDQPPRKRARLDATDIPPINECHQQPVVLPIQFLQNVAPETITSWFDPTELGHGHRLPGATAPAERANRTADPTLEPRLGSSAWPNLDDTMPYGRWCKSEDVFAPNRLELSVGNYDWIPETWGVKTNPSEQNTALEGLTFNAIDQSASINSNSSPESSQSIVDDYVNSLSMLYSFDSTVPSYEAATFSDLDYLFGNYDGHASNSVLAEDSQFGAEATYAAFDGQQDFNEDWFNVSTDVWSIPTEIGSSPVDDALLGSLSVPEWDLPAL